MDRVYHDDVVVRLMREEACELLLECAGNTEGVEVVSAAAALPLLEALTFHPMAVALAAATVSIYQTLLHSEQSPMTICKYKKLLVDQTSLGEDVLQASLSLFLEASVSDPRVRHTYDLIGLFDLDFPFLASIIPVHLSSDFCGIPREQLLPSTLKPSTSDLKEYSYLDSIKNYIPFLQSKVEVNTQTPQDELGFLRQCPLLSFKHYSQADVELVTVHSSAVPSLRQLFKEVTCPKLDNDHVQLKKREFQRNAWFRNYRTFDNKNCLVQFHRSLPGLSSPGVLTAHEFASLPARGSDKPDLTYSQYVHTVSHHHRVTESLLATLKLVKGEVSGYFLEKSLLPHISAMKAHLLSPEDELSVNILIASIQAISLSGSNLKRCLSSYGQLLDEQKKLLGPQNTAVASSLVDYADILLSTGNTSQAKELLQCVLSGYKQLSARARDEVSLDVGHAMSSLGHVYTQLGNYEESKNCYEHALMLYQSAPVQGQVDKKQQRLISSLLIDVTHSHLVLGDLPTAKKYSELGIAVLQSLYPGGSLETVRLLETSSIITSLLGDKEGSSKLLSQASTIKAKVNKNTNL